LSTLASDGGVSPERERGKEERKKGGRGGRGVKADELNNESGTISLAASLGCEKKKRKRDEGRDFLLAKSEKDAQVLTWAKIREKKRKKKREGREGWGRYSQQHTY